MPQGGEALHRNSIITFSSLARRLEAQTAAVPSSSRSSLRAAPRSSLQPPPPAGLCLLHRTDAFCRQASALKETQATFLSPESLQWTEPPEQEHSPSFPASQSTACASFLVFLSKLQAQGHDVKCEVNRLKCVERLSLNNWMESFTAVAFEGVFDTFFKVRQVQSVVSAMEEYSILLL